MKSEFSYPNLNLVDAQYHSLLERVLNSDTRPDRTGTGTYSIFGHQMRFKNVYEHFPLLTTKRVHMHAVVHELIWMLRGETNIKYLVDNDVGIWTDWPLKFFRQENPGIEMSREQFSANIKENDVFANKWGNCGPVYGKQWRNWETPAEEYGGDSIDQIAIAIDMLKNNPTSRRNIISAWNAADIEQMTVSGLPPCHLMFQFYTRDIPEEFKEDYKPINDVVPTKYLDCQVYIRSNDLFLGAPFNMAQYALLMHIIGNEVNMIPGDLVYTIGDAHIYSNHVEQVEEQLSRSSAYEIPTVRVFNTKDGRNFETIIGSDVEIYNYNPHNAIKAPIAV